MSPSRSIKKALNETECIKYLGIIIDSSLSWKHHILSLRKFLDLLELCKN